MVDRCGVIDEQGYYSKEGYCIDYRVQPYNKNQTPDVMLVQFLIFQYFASDAATQDEKNDFAQIYMRVTDNGKRWDDGLYGKSTVAAVKLFENSAHPKQRSLIFEASSGYVASGVEGLDPLFDSGNGLDWLNWAFDRQYNGNVNQKHKIFYGEANPVLFIRLFPNGILSDGSEPVPPKPYMVTA